MKPPWPSMRQNNQNTGQWDQAIEQNKTSTKAHAIPTGGLIFSTPIIDENEILYVGSSDHIFRAYNPVSKKIEWEFPTKEVIDSAGALHPNGTIIIPSGDGNIYCVDKHGNQVWAFDVTSNRTPDQFSFATSYWWEGNIAIDTEGYIYAGNDDFFLYCLNPNGTLKWKYRTGLFIWASVVFDDQHMVYASSFDGTIYAINRDTGKLIWKTDARNPLIASPAIYNDMLFQCTLGGKLIVINRHTGKNIWSTKIPYHVYASPLITPDNKVITASSSGEIIAFNIKTRKQEWIWKEFSVVRSSPVVGPDPEKKSPYLIYCGNADGELFALDAYGQLRWRLATAPEGDTSQRFVINASLAIGRHGIAAPVGKYIYYIPFDHYLSSVTEIPIHHDPQKNVLLTALQEADTYILDNIHITSPSIIPTLDQIGLQSLTISIGIVEKNEEAGTFLAHGTLIFGRDKDGALIGVPHSQTYSFAFYGIQHDTSIELTAKNIFFETSGFPFPLDELRIKTTGGLADTNVNLRAYVHEKGPLKTFASVILAYNTSHTPKSVVQNITSIEDIPHIFNALVRLIVVSAKFIIRQYWKDWGLFDEHGSITCIGMASLQPAPSSALQPSLWRVAEFSFDEARTMYATLTTTNAGSRVEELSIIVANKTTLQPIEINYSKSVLRKKLSGQSVQLSLSIPEQYNTSDLVAYIVDKTLLLDSYPLYPANPGK